MKAKKFIISGRVQGVGYRYFTQINAIKLKIRGYVRNLYNGDVEVYAIGDEDSLVEFREILRKGPPASRVINIEERDVPADKNYTSFDITY